MSSKSSRLILWVLLVVAVAPGWAYGEGEGPPPLTSPSLDPPGLASDAFPLDKDAVEKGDGGRIELDEADVVFSASKKRQLTTEAPSTIHVITAEQIDRYGWRSFADLLRMVPGVQVRTYLSQYHSVMIRGLLGTEVNNTRILWLENGIPFTDVRDGGVWLDETYPVEFIKRVEVVLGPGSTLYGTGAFQGVVNVFTKSPRDIPEHGEYHLGVGSARTLRASALGGAILGPVELLVFGSANVTDGPGLVSRYRYEEKLREAGADAVRNNKSPLDPAFAPEGEGVNSSRSWQHLRVLATLKPVKLSLGFKNVDAGYDGAEFFATERYQFDHREVFADLFYDQELGEDLKLTAITSYRFFQNHYEDFSDLDPASIVRVDGEPDPRYPDRVLDKINYNTNQHKLFNLIQLQVGLFTGNELIAGLGGRYEAIDAPEFESGRTSQDSFNVSGFVQDEQKLFGDTLILTGGVRVDQHRAFGFQPSYRAAILYKWTDWLLSRFSYATAFREPSMWQLYIDHVDARGNAGLESETLQNFEFSTIARLAKRWTLRLDGFFTLMDNLILNDFNRDPELAVPYLGIQGKFNPRQTGNTARMGGLEVSVRAEVTEAFSLFAHYNWLRSDARRCDGCDFQAIDYDAEHSGGVGVAYSGLDSTASLKAHFVGPTVDSTLVDVSDPENPVTIERTVPFYTILQPHIRVRLPGAFAAFAQGSYALSEGLSDVPTRDFYYETLNVPVPRFSFLVGLGYPY